MNWGWIYSYSMIAVSLLGIPPVETCSRVHQQIHTGTFTAAFVIVKTGRCISGRIVDCGVFLAVGILNSNENEWPTAKCNNMDGSLKLNVT